MQERLGLAKREQWALPIRHMTPSQKFNFMAPLHSFGVIVPFHQLSFKSSELSLICWCTRVSVYRVVSVLYGYCTDIRVLTTYMTYFTLKHWSSGQECYTRTVTKGLHSLYLKYNVTTMDLFSSTEDVRSYCSWVIPTTGMLLWMLCSLHAGLKMLEFVLNSAPGRH